MIYLLLVNIAMGIGFGLYHLCFRKLTFFQWNRVYLLGIVVVSFLIPVGLFVDLSDVFVREQILPVVNLEEVMDIVYIYEVSDEQSYRFVDILSMLYWAGVIVGILLLVLRLRKVSKAFAFRYEYASFSFFRKVFLGSKVQDERMIGNHEQVHVDQGHSYDIVLLEIVCVLNWFNPIVYLIRKELKFQHECIADEFCSQDKVAYAELLVAHAMRTNPSHLVHYFSNQSFLKKRIMMLFKNKSSNRSKLLYLTGIPVVLTIISSTIVFNTSRAKEVVSKIETQLTDVSFSKVSEGVDYKIPVKMEEDLMIAIQKKNTPVQQEKIVEHPEILAEPPGGMVAFRKWIGKNYKYPQKAIDAGLKGTINVSFVVEKDGGLSHLNVKEKLGHGADEAALELLRKSSKWSPAIHNGKAVRTAFTLPIRLDLTTVSAKEERNEVFTEVENAPQPANGMAAFRKWIGDNYQYPSGAIDAGVKGTIWVQFIVEKDGTLSNIKSTEDLGYGTGEAAVNLLLKSPKWNPGVQNSHTVRVEYKLPIRLDLTNM